MWRTAIHLRFTALSSPIHLATAVFVLYLFTYI